MEKALIAIDIGTTNIEAVLATEDLKTIDFKCETNGQKKFGNDVAARICAAADGHAEEMRVSVLGCICGLVTGFAAAHPEYDISRVAIAGNTVMLHILMGYDCSGLGMFPFTPFSLEAVSTTTLKLVEDFIDGEEAGLPDIPVMILPGISAYTGADIYAGAVALDLCGRDNKDEINLLVDLGTNAELVLGGGSRMLVASAAAGPAFESGRIFKGTEGIERLHRLRTLGVIDSTGLMGEEYYEKPAQKNIRRLQLAKAAIRAAIGIMLDKYGTEASGVANIYVSGNFGNHLNEEACIAVGMFPEQFAGRIYAAGNTVLQGCLKYASEPEKRIPVSYFEEVVLANEPGFNDMLIGSVEL